ncbi:MAG: hypothetical protein AABY36_00970, partial [Campylobacterota bacterium]
MIKAIFFLLVASSLLFGLNCEQYGVFTQHNGHYYTTTKDRLTFGYAKTFAELGNGYLAIPNNSAENEFLVSLILGNQFAWIGIEDPSLSNSYCYPEEVCNFSDTRFKTVKNEALIYKNWATGQPDNLIKDGDTTVVPVITPLGEHWVALNSVNYKWYDFGNHADQYNNPAKFMAVYEFDTRPECFHDDNSSELVDLHCNTAISFQNEQTADSGQLLQCQTDANGVPFCPASLAACQNTQNTNDGYSQEHTMTTTTRDELVCPTGTNLPIDCSGSYSIAWLKDMYTTLLNRCPDQAGYDFWKAEIERLGITQQSQLQPTFCTAAARNNEPCGSATPSATTCYGTTLQNVTVQQPVTTTNAMTCPTGTNLPSQCTGSYSNTWLKDMYTTLLNRCPDQAGYDFWKAEIERLGITQQSQLQPTFCTAAARNNEPCGSATPSATTCYGTTLQNVTVQQPVTTTGSLGCSSGGSLSGTTCLNTCSSTSYSCPSGGSLSGTTCNTSGSYSATATINNRQYPVYEYACKTGNGGWSKHDSYSYPSGCRTPADKKEYWNCNQGGCFAVSYSAANCKTTTDSDFITTHWVGCSSTSYSCPSGGSLSGTTCNTSGSYSATASYSSWDCNYAATCPTGTNLPSQCNGSYSITWLKDMYTTLLNRCPDQAGYDFWKAEIERLGITQQSQLQPTFCTAAARNNEPCGSATPSATTCYGTTLQNVTVQQPVTTTNAMTCPTGTNLPSQCTGSYSNTWLKDMYTTLLNRCPDQAGYDFWKAEIERLGITQQSQLQPTFCTAAARNNEPCGSATPSATTCYGTTLQNVTV